MQIFYHYGGAFQTIKQHLSKVSAAAHRSCQQLFLWLALVFVAGCSETPASLLTIGTNNWIGYQPFYVAREKGYLDSRSIKLVELNSSTDIMHELRSHQLDGAALTLDEVLTLMQQGVAMRVILVVDISNGGDVLLAKPGIDSVQQLAGKTVAVEYTAVGATVLDAALDSAGLTIEQVNILSCAWDKHVECFKDADAVVTFEPAKTRLIREGAISVFDSSQIKGRIIDVLAVRTEIAESNPMVIRSLVEGYFKALEYMQRQPAAANEIIQRRTQMSAQEVNAMLGGIDIPGRSGNKDMLSGDELRANAEQLLQLMLSKKLLDKAVSIDKLFTHGYLQY